MTVKELIDALTGLPEDMEVAAVESGGESEIWPVLRVVKVKAELENGVYELDDPLDPSPKAFPLLVIVS